MKKSVKLFLNKCKKEKFHNHESIEQYYNNKKLYVIIQKKKKGIYKNSILYKLSHCNGSKIFWNIINRFRSRSNCKNEIDLDTWHIFFTEFFKVKETPKEQKFLVELTDKNYNAELELPITKDEIIFALSKCKNNKSPGADEITFEFLKNLPEKWIDFVNLLLNNILIEERVPKTWSNINLKMIYKKGDTSDPSNYRPKALVNCIPG